MKNILFVLALVVAFIFGIHADAMLPDDYDEYLYIHEDWSESEFDEHDFTRGNGPRYYNPPAPVADQPIYEVHESNTPHTIQKSISDGYGEPIQEQIQIELDIECLDQLDYYEGEQRRGDDDPFIDYRINQLKERCD